MYERFMANIGAKIREFQRKMKEVDKTVQKAAMGTEVPVDAETAKAKRKLLELQKIKQSINDKVIVRVEAKVEKFQRRMDRIAQSMNSFGTVAGNAFRGGFIAALPTLSPIIGTMVGGAGALASSFTAAFGGLGAFGVAAMGNADKLAKSMDEIAKINERIASTTDQAKINELLSQRANIMSKMSSEQIKAMEQVNKFKGAWNDFLKQTEKPVFQVFAAGLKVATSLLKEIKPIIQPVADVLTNLLNKFNAFSKTKQFQSFIDFFANRGSKAIENWGTIAGNIFTGFMELMKAFAPLAGDMENGLIGMTEKFAEWASKLSQSKAFQKFIDFVKTNAPKVLGLIGNITNFLIQLGIGMAPLGTKILDLVNGFLSWITNLMKANPLIGKIVSWVISLTGVLIAILPGILLFGGTFFSIILKIGGILKWFIGGPIGLLVGALLMVVPFVIKNWDAIWKGTKQVFTKIGNLFKNVWNGMVALVKIVVFAIVNWVKTSFQNIKDSIKQRLDAAKRVVSAVWNGIKSAFSNTLGALWQLVKSKFSDMVNAVRNKMNDAKNKVKEIWGNIKDFFSGINLYESGKKIIGSAIDGIMAMKDKVVNKVKDIAQSIRDFFPFSPPKRGPLTDLHKINFAWAVTKSIDNAKSKVQRSMNSLSSVAMNSFTPDLAIADMRASAVLDTDINPNAINQSLSAELDNFELPDRNVNVYVEGDAEWIRAYVNDENALESETKTFNE